MNLINCCEKNITAEKEAVVSIGIHKSYWHVDLDEDVLFVFYVIDGEVYNRTWSSSPEDFREAVWEWLCTASRVVSGDGSRLLGSYRRVLEA